MICLFLDSSSDSLKVSLLDNDKIIYNEMITTKNDHSSFLVPCIKEAFEENNLKYADLDRIIVAIGPGSFTGTRIGITVAKVYAYSFDIECFGISTLESMIYSYDNYDYYVPIIEEKNNMMYFGIYDKNRKRVFDDSYVSKDKLYDILEKYDGNILIISRNNVEYDGYISLEEKTNPIEINKNILVNNISINPHLLKPNYIKKIEAESKL